MTCKFIVVIGVLSVVGELKAAEEDIISFRDTGSFPDKGISEVRQFRDVAHDQEFITHWNYCIVDLSGGSSVAKYPVSWANQEPSGGWTDVYKTTKLVLRRIEAGTFIMGEDKTN